MKEPKTKEFFARYAKPLRCVFEFYTKVEDVEIADRVELSASTMQYRAFVKFTIQTKMAPTLISNEEVVMIYKLIMKEKAEKTRSLDYDDFLESLVRIAIRGHSKLDKLRKASESEAKAGDKKASAGSMLFFDVKEINVATLESLMRLLEFSPSEKRSVLTQRLVELQHEGIKDARLKQKNAVANLSKPLSPSPEPEVEEDETEKKEEEPVEETEAKNQETQMSGELEVSPAKPRPGKKSNRPT